MSDEDRGQDRDRRTPTPLPTLPPPAFPPGPHRERARRRLEASRSPAAASPDIAEAGEGLPDEAIIDPDQPIVRTDPPATPDDYEEVLAGAAGPDEPAEGQVVVTGVGESNHLEELRAGESYGDAPLARLVEKVDRLARELRQRGEEALRIDAGMSRLEADLRSYCSGYLAGRRED